MFILDVVVGVAVAGPSLSRFARTPAFPLCPLRPNSEREGDVAAEDETFEDECDDEDGALASALGITSTKSLPQLEHVGPVPAAAAAANPAFPHAWHLTLKRCRVALRGEEEEEAPAATGPFLAEAAEAASFSSSSSTTTTALDAVAVEGRGERSSSCIGLAITSASTI